jgi:pilus assembly protein CpaB
MGRRTLLLVAALVVAALGTSLVFLYVDRVDERAMKDQSPVEVLVAKSPIKAGTTGEQAETQGAFQLQRIPLAAAVEGYLHDTRTIAKRIAAADIFPGEQIIPQKFVEPGTSTVLPIPAGKLAMSVQLGDPQRVAGFVRPGSEVAIFVTLRQGLPPGAAGGSLPKGAFTRLLLPRVGVVAIGPTTLRPATKGEGNTESLPTAILSLAVDQKQAQKIIFAADQGQLYFGLVDKDSKVAPGAGTDLTTLFG